MTLALIVSAALLGLAAIDSSGAGVTWDLFNGTGLVGVAFLVALQVETLRHRLRLAHPAAGAITTHTRLAYLAFAAIAIHATGLLLTDSVTLEYVSPSAPVYMMAGLATVALIVWLAVTSRPGRRRAHADPPGFRNIHRYAGLVLLALSVWHVAGSGHYFDSWPSQVAIASLLVAFALAPAPIARRALIAPQPGLALTTVIAAAEVSVFTLAQNY